jgi:hypothetical protein
MSRPAMLAARSSSSRSNHEVPNVVDMCGTVLRQARTIDIRTGAVVGKLPQRTLAHVQGWRRLHESELLSAWGLARAEMPLPRIEPLE